jgi:hypothetical protein
MEEQKMKKKTSGHFFLWYYFLIFNIFFNLLHFCLQKIW